MRSEQPPRPLPEEEENAEKITLERIEDSLKTGTPMTVKVKRHSGVVEEGWTILAGTDEGIVVVKSAEGGQMLRRVVPLKELQETNRDAV